MTRFKTFLMGTILLVLLVSVAGVGAQDNSQPVAQIEVGGSVEGMMVMADGTLLVMVDGKPVNVAPNGAISNLSVETDKDMRAIGTAVADYLAENGMGNEPAEPEMALLAVAPDGSAYVGIGEGRAILHLGPNGDLLGGWAATSVDADKGGWAAISADNNAGGWSAISAGDNAGGWASTSAGDNVGGWASTSAGDNVGGWSAISASDNAGGWASISAVPGSDGSLYVTVHPFYNLVRMDPTTGLIEDYTPAMAAMGDSGEVNIMAAGPSGEVFVTITNNHYVFRSEPDGVKAYEYLADEKTPVALAAFGPNGDLFVNLQNSDEVMQLDSRGRLSNIFGGPEMFNGIAALGVDAKGQLIVAGRIGNIGFFDTGGIR